MNFVQDRMNAIRDCCPDSMNFTVEKVSRLLRVKEIN